MQSIRDKGIPDRIRPGVVAILISMILIAIAATYAGALRLFEAQAISVAQSQHALYLRSLNEAIKQHQHLPFVLSQNPAFADQLLGGDTPRLNETLAAFAAASGLEAIYLMNLEGVVIAASNHADETSFLGQNYGFRPYFQNAATGAHSDYFAIGATTGRPGYFVAEPLRDTGGDIVGVVAIKLDISELQASWEERGELVLATNADGIVVLSSAQGWLYRSIADIDAARRAEISASRQFGAEALAPLSWRPEPAGRVAVEGEAFLLISGPTEVVRWTVHYLTPQSAIRRQTFLATGVLGFFIIALIGFSVFLRSRRIQAALDLSQKHRRELIQTNERLLQAQEELARSSKLAALGQLSASVTHELGQPIAALKNHLFAAEIGNEITSPETAANLRRLAERMEAITRQLKFFARQGAEEWAPTDMTQVIREALALMRHDFDADRIDVSWRTPESPCLVNGDQLQLEQAMVNLLRNALLACRDGGKAEIAIACSQGEKGVCVQVADSGPGLQGRSLTTLQEPFYSTQSSGDGMGLGLAITTEIIRAHRGALSAQDGPNGGAVFQITLPAAGDPA